MPEDKYADLRKALKDGYLFQLIGAYGEIKELLAERDKFKEALEWYAITLPRFHLTMLWRAASNMPGIFGIAFAQKVREALGMNDNGNDK